MNAKIGIFFLIISLPFLMASDFSDDNKKGFNKENCSFNGIALHGKIQFVESFPDIKIKFVESFPDLKVKFVTSFPDDCGEWQITNSFPDIKVQIVESFPDIKVKVVESFPGCK